MLAVPNSLALGMNYQPERGRPNNLCIHHCPMYLHQVDRSLMSAVISSLHHPFDVT